MSSTESVYLSLETVVHYVQHEEISQGVKFVTQTKSADFGSDGKMQLMVYTSQVLSRVFVPLPLHSDTRLRIAACKKLASVRA